MTVGVIVGTFDMFHVGHLNLCIKAKNNCDILIAGVNRDHVVLRDKHKAPIIPENDRLQILNHIDCVSNAYLVEDNAVQFIYDLIASGQKVDFYFRGDEEKESIRIENQQIEAMGCKVVMFPYYQGVSSSELRLKQQKH